MVIALPKEAGALDRRVGELNARQAMAKMKRVRVAVQIPKFKTTSAYPLAQALKAMGMRAPFGRGADFSGMDGTQDLFLSAVEHKAFVSIDENGTEAAAATAAVMTLKGERPSGETKVFTVDRPFIYLIRDTRTGCILFIGRVVDPR